MPHPSSVIRLVVALALLTPPAHAQLGAALGVRSLTGDETSAGNADRRGVEGRLQYGRDPWGAFGWQAELIGAQMRFQRDEGMDSYKVSENHLEVATLLRARLTSGPLAGGYALAGPVGGFRVHCGASGQNSTACDAGDDAGTGVVLGVGYRTGLTPRRDLTVEIRYYDGVVAGAGAPILSLGVGLVVAQR